MVENESTETTIEINTESDAFKEGVKLAEEIKEADESHRRL